MQCSIESRGPGSDSLLLHIGNPPRVTCCPSSSGKKLNAKATVLKGVGVAAGSADMNATAKRVRRDEDSSEGGSGPAASGFS